MTQRTQSPRMREVKKLAKVGVKPNAAPLAQLLTPAEDGNRLEAKELAKVLTALGPRIRQLALEGLLPTQDALKGASTQKVDVLARAVANVMAALKEQSIRKYHQLADKQLQGKASSDDLLELARIERDMEAIEEEQTSAIEVTLERRHRAMMDKLTELTRELQRNSNVAER